MSTAIRIREAREAAGLSRVDLAARSGVGARTIEAYEQGRAEPTVRRAQKIAAALGLSLDRLLGAETTSDEAA